MPGYALNPKANSQSAFWIHAPIFAVIIQHKEGELYASWFSQSSPAWYFPENIRDCSRRFVKTPESEALWRSRHGCCFPFAEMPVRAVTTRFMYKGLCTIPDVLSYRTPVHLPEDEVEGELWRILLNWLWKCLVVITCCCEIWEVRYLNSCSFSALRRAPLAVRFFLLTKKKSHCAQSVED